MVHSNIDKPPFPIILWNIKLQRGISYVSFLDHMEFIHPPRMLAKLPKRALPQLQKLQKLPELPQLQKLLLGN